MAQSCPTLWPHQLHSPWNSPGQNTGVGILSLLQGIFPTQGSNPGLLHCRWILYQLSHKGSPRILEWVAYPFSRNLPNPAIQPGSSALQGYSLPTELSVKPPPYLIILQIGKTLTRFCALLWLLVPVKEHHPADVSKTATRCHSSNKLIGVLPSLEVSLRSCCRFWVEWRLQGRCIISCLLWPLQYVRLMILMLICIMVGLQEQLWMLIAAGCNKTKHHLGWTATGKVAKVWLFKHLISSQVVSTYN